MNAISPELDPLEIDPRPCELCGCTIDQHQCIDTSEGPEFFCDDLETQIYLAAADLMKRWELADPRDRWRHTGEPHPKASVIPNARPEPYCTPASVVDEFFSLPTSMIRIGSKHGCLIIRKTPHTCTRFGRPTDVSSQRRDD
jgi:hypothetical protein